MLFVAPLASVIAKPDVSDTVPDCVLTAAMGILPGLASVILPEVVRAATDVAAVTSVAMPVQAFRVTTPPVMFSEVPLPSRIAPLVEVTLTGPLVVAVVRVTLPEPVSAMFPEPVAALVTLSVPPAFVMPMLPAAALAAEMAKADMLAL